jgi:hypothetical protein
MQSVNDLSLDELLQKPSPPEHEVSRDASPAKQGVASTIDSLNLLLEQDEVALKPSSKREFNGIDSLEEQEEVYSRALHYQRDKTKSVEEQIKDLEQEKDKEKRALEAQIRELRRELHRTAPLHDTKFFSLTKQLEEAITDLNKVAEASESSLQQIAGVVPNREQPLGAEALSMPSIPEQATERMPAPVQPSPAIPSPVASDPKTVQPPPAETQKRNLSKNKVMLTGAAAVVLLFLISGAVASVVAEPKVDEELVAQYLTAQSGKVAGQVQGAETGGLGDTAAVSDAPAIDPAQAEVTFDETVWEDFNDPTFGIMLQYPKNAVKPVRTDSNVTFIRKTGYLFKIQRIETSLTVDEYWKQIKSTSLNYTESEDTFKGKKALKLTLEDAADYPGNRYLIREGGFVYDIWYATKTAAFTDDDLARVEKMLASLSIIGPQ